MVQVDQLFPRSNSVWGQYCVYVYIYMGKLQITFLKFGGIWILHLIFQNLNFIP